MARIRSIKPEFWTSSKILECSTNARLLFIGLWNFSDDTGRHPWQLKQIKAEIYPGDPFKENDILGMLLELSKNNLITKYVVDNNEYMLIHGWDHQRIDKPQPSKYPAPLTDDSGNILGTLPPDRIGEDRIGEDRGENKKSTRFNPPTEQEVVEYFIASGYLSEVGRRAFKGYDTAEWKDSRGKKIRNWKQKMIHVWFRDENKSPDITKGAV